MSMHGNGKQCSISVLLAVNLRVFCRTKMENEVEDNRLNQIVLNFTAFTNDVYVIFIQ